MDVGSISNSGGGTTLRGHFFLKKKGTFFKVKRALLCLLQNLGGARTSSAPRFLRLWIDFKMVALKRVVMSSNF